MRKRVAVLILLAAAAAFALGMGLRHGGPMRGRHMMAPPPPSAGENPLPGSERVLAQGAKAYLANCAVCHGDKGLGDGPSAAGLNPRPPDLRAAAETWSDGQIAALIRFGRGAMPPFSQVLDNETLWSIAHYVRRGIVNSR